MPEHRENSMPLRRADNGERFVAFAFAAADLVAEIDTAGLLTFAAGAFRTRFGRASEAWVGSHVRDLVSPADHEALDLAMLMLMERGRLLPLTVRLANAGRTQMALAGIKRSPADQSHRYCLTFALLPAPVGRVMQANCAHGVARTAEARLRRGTATDLALVEVSGSSAELVGSTIEALAPEALASELSPGRYSLLAGPGSGTMLTAIAGSLESALLDQGVIASVSARTLNLVEEGLSSSQAARALRQALDLFSRSGTAGLDAAGFTSGLASYVKDAMQHTGAMREAILRRRFDLMFQPIVELADRRVHHYEALLRPHPVPGCPVNNTQEFVVLAETIGLAFDLDFAVVGMACEAALHAPAPIAFNVSGQSMQDADFRDKLLARLVRDPARKAGRLLVEMTETAQLEDIPEAAKTAQMLRDLGVPFCLDDFGAGSADMRVLRGMPADLVKLDGSYIAGIDTEGRERAFMAGMIEIARAARAEVVAEWVETEPEAVALAAMGARFGQGWLFGRAAPLPSR